jgi:hypothetical protein
MMRNATIRTLIMIFVVITYAAGQTPNSSAASKPASRPQAQPQDVRCPVPEVRTEITTRLPKPWWNTPQEGKLQALAIQTIGGKKTLVCRYWAYGTQVSVMRLFPEGTHECNAVSDHFVCR